MDRRIWREVCDVCSSQKLFRLKNENVNYIVFIWQDLELIKWALVQIWKAAHHLIQSACKTDYKNKTIQYTVRKRTTSIQCHSWYDRHVSIHIGRERNKFTVQHSDTSVTTSQMLKCRDSEVTSQWSVETVKWLAMGSTTEVCYQQE